MRYRQASLRDGRDNMTEANKNTVTASSGAGGKTEANKNTATAPSGAGSEGEEISRPLGALAGLFFYVIIGLFVVWNNQTAQGFLRRNIWPLGISAVIVLFLLVIAWYQQGGLTASSRRHIGLAIFAATPILLALVTAIYVIPDKYHVTMLRSVFLLIVCLLPATMYYLFIASRKSSLLQEYFTNLSRLGLFGRQPRRGDDGQPPEQESELERHVRVMSYIQKFEAVYGAIPKKLADDIIAATDPSNSAPKVPAFHQYSTGGALGGIFTPETTIPVVLATLLIGLGWLLTLPPWEVVAFQPGDTIIQRLRRVLQPCEVAVHFAFLGAYFFSLQMLFRRYVRKDLRANAYIAVSLRIILAVIGAWAVIEAAPILKLGGQAGGDEHKALLLTGFVIGAFPPIAWQVIQAALRTVTFAKFIVPSLNSEMPVSELDGLTVWHEARLEEEDIENVPNMATADLVELMLHTRLPPDRIVDWMDQAMLYTQLGPNKTPVKNEDKEAALKSPRQRLAEHGIRTASALVAAYEKSKARNDLDSFENILPFDGRSPIRSLVDTLAINPNLELVRQWRRH
jgi:hypothetical protein